MAHRPIHDPEVLAFIAKTEASYPANANVATAEENRRYYDAMCAVFRQPRPPSVAVRDGILGGVRIRHYRPAGMRDSGPAIVYLHGGGLVVGSLESHDDICAEIAQGAGMAVTAVDYRLAPEHPWPSQLDDVEAVWRQLAARTGRLIAVGDSAGANLCAGLSLRLRRLGGPMPIAQVLIYPGLGGEATSLSYIENGDAPLLRTTDVLAYRDAAVHEASSQVEIAELAPLMAADFGGLPASWVFTADVDPLRDDGEAYVQCLHAQGIKAVWRNHDQLVHGHLRGRTMSRRIRAAFDEIITAIVAAGAIDPDGGLEPDGRGG
jgi:acetyl esterase